MEGSRKTLGIQRLCTVQVSIPLIACVFFLAKMNDVQVLKSHHLNCSCRLAASVRPAQAHRTSRVKNHHDFHPTYFEETPTNFFGFNVFKIIETVENEKVSVGFSFSPVKKKRAM